MAAHAEPIGGHGHDEHHHHGPPPIHYSSRIHPSSLGIFLFIGSEIMLFGSFFTVYFFDRVVQRTHWPPLPRRDPLPVVRRARQHGHPRHLELHVHWATTVDQAQRQSRRVSAPG